MRDRDPCRSGYRSDQDEGQVPGRVQRSPASGAGKGVSLQPLHHHSQEVGAGSRVGTLGKTSKILSCKFLDI
jgi:hypothetical protein